MQNSKIITVVETYTTHLRVSSNWGLIRASDDDISSLLTSTIPEKGKDQIERLLLLTVFNTGEQGYFNKEDLWEVQKYTVL